MPAITLEGSGKAECFSANATSTNLASAAASVFLLRPEFEVLRIYLDQLKAP